MTRPPVRPMLASDRARVAESLARAFDRDVPFNYGIRQDAGRERAMRLAFATLFDRFLPYGMSFVVDEGAGAALWCRHDQWAQPLWRELALLPTLLRCTGLQRLPRAVRALEAMKAHDPKQPHHYLFAIGVDPRAQGLGLGGALLQPTLDRCDRERLPAYLESTSPDNRAFYLRHGFEIVEEFPIGPDAPRITGMLRRPGS